MVTNLVTTQRNEVPAGYKQTEAGIIPKDWEASLVGELFSFKNGLNKNKQYFGFGTPIVNYMDVYKHTGLRNSDLKGRVSLSRYEIKTFNVRKGDVFFTRTSETAIEVGIASVMLDDPIDTVFSGFLLRARPRGATLDNKFKQYCFSIGNVRRQIVSSSTETTRALTNGRLLSAVVIAYPPLPEQRAIATALSDVDDLITALDKLIAKKRAIKLATMQQLLTGKTRLPGFSGEWEIRTISQLADVTMGQSPDSKHYNNKGSGLPLIQGNADISNRHTISRVWTTQVTKRCDAGDIILTVRAPVGEVGVASEPSCIGRGVCSLKPKVDGSFLYHALVFIENQWKQFEQGSTFTSANSTQVGQFIVHLPRDLEEQRTIATVLSDMDAVIVALEQRREKLRAIKQGVMQALLTGRVRLVNWEASS